MNDETTEFAMIQPVYKAGWSVMDDDAREAFARETMLGVAESHPEIETYLPETFEWEAAEQATIEGLHFPSEDEEGNPLPEMVFVKATVRAVRKAVA